MKIMTRCLSLFLCLQILALDAPAAQRVVGAYFAEWSVYRQPEKYDVDKIPWNKITHLLYAFLPICGPNESLKIDQPAVWDSLNKQCEGRQPYEAILLDPWAAFDAPEIKTFPKLQAQKARNPHVKILASIGGWTMSDPFFAMAADPNKRRIFINSTLTFLDKYPFFDGIDIDWEYPGGGGMSATLGSPADKANHLALIRELRAALDSRGRGYLLTSATGAAPAKIKAIDYAAIFAGQPLLDLVFSMTYDYYGAWNGERGHSAGLYPGAKLVDGFSTQETIDNLLASGVPPERLVIGVQGVGHAWSNVEASEKSGLSRDAQDVGGESFPIVDGMVQNGHIDYKLIENRFAKDGAYEYFYDQDSQAPVLYSKSEKKLITFEDRCSAQAKMNFAAARKLAGSFMWSLDSDNGRLLDVMAGASPNNAECPCIQEKIPGPNPSEGMPGHKDQDFVGYEGEAKGRCIAGLNPRKKKVDNNDAITSPVHLDHKDPPAYENRRLDQVSFITSHNSFADNKSGGWLFAIPNQKDDIPGQLKQGVRGFMIDLYTSRDGEAIVCHVTCGLAGLNPWISFTDILKQIEVFLYDNPDEFITLHLEMGGDATGDDALGMPHAGPVTGKSVRASFDVFPGLKSWIFDPYQADVKNKGWPTIGELRKMGKRVLVLAQQDKPETREIGFAHDMEFIVENNWEMHALDRKCFTRWDEHKLDEGVNDAGPFRRLFVMNHFNAEPVLAQAAIDNQARFIKERVENDCLPFAKRMPNYVALDFVGAADEFEALKWLNNDVRGIAYYGKNYDRAYKVIDRSNPESAKGKEGFPQSMKIFFEGTRVALFKNEGDPFEWLTDITKSTPDLSKKTDGVETQGLQGF